MAERTLHDAWAESPTAPAARPPRPSGKATGRPRSLVIRDLVALLFFGLVVAAIAAPNFVGCRCKGSPAAAIGSLRTLYTAQAIYRESEVEVVDRQAQYAESLAELSATGTDLIDDVLGTGSKQSYRFQISADPEGYSWDATAWAATEEHGQRRFYTNQSGVIWFSEDDVRTPALLNSGTGEAPPGFRKLGS